MAKSNDADLSRDELILKYLPRVEKTVRRYVQKHHGAKPYADDITGEATLRLVEVAELFFSKKIDNFGGYLHQSIREAIANVLRDSPIIKTRAKNPPAILFGNVDKLLARPVPDKTYEDAFDDILHVIKGPRDAAIVQHRWDGLTLDETATKMGVSVQTVRRRLKKMRERYAKAAQDAIGTD